MSVFRLNILTYPLDLHRVNGAGPSIAADLKLMCYYRLLFCSNFHIVASVMMICQREGRCQDSFGSGLTVGEGQLLPCQARQA